MKSYDKKINQLLDMYIKAEKRLITIISTKKVKGQVTDFYESMLKQVKFELMQLQIQSTIYSKDIVEELYLEAYKDALKTLDIDSIGDGFTKLHKDAINTISDNLINNFAEVNNQVGRRIEDTIREIGLTKSQMKFASGQTIKQLQRELLDSLINTGLGGITDKRGRVIPFIAYAELLGRSIVAETQNTSVINVMKEHENDLVKMTSHKTACSVCVKYEGKIYSISGSGSRYPALNTIPGFSRGYNNIHPNCRHRITPFIEKYSDEYIQKNKETLEVAKNKDSNVIKFELNGMKEDAKKRVINTITKLANEYNTSLNSVRRGAGGSAGKVDMAFNMYLSSTKNDDIVHEFAHSLGMTHADKLKLTNNKPFWKEIKKIRKEYEKACSNNPSKSISAYSHEDVDEFMAEAFTHAYLKDTEFLSPWNGKDFEYSDKVKQVIDKYFRK